MKRRRDLLRNSYLGDQMKSQLPGLGQNPASLPVLSSAFLILENRCIIFKLIREQMIDDTGELVCKASPKAIETELVPSVMSNGTKFKVAPSVTKPGELNESANASIGFPSSVLTGMNTKS